MDRAYLTYEEYVQMGGELSENDFILAEFRARKYIDYLTDSRVADMAEIPQAVKLCIMTCIKVEAKFGADAQSDTPLLASYNTDGYSESYGSAADRASAAYRSLGRSIRSMLWGEEDDYGVPLLYRGVNGY